MFGPCSALLLLLGLASPGASQAPNTAVWTLALSDFTIYGHTIYTPTLVLVPRIVYDTARGVDSARVVDSVRAAAKITPGSRPASSAGRPTSIVADPRPRRCSRSSRGRCWAGSSLRRGATSAW